MTDTDERQQALPVRELSAADYPAWLEAAMEAFAYVFGLAHEDGEGCFLRFQRLRARHQGGQRQQFAVPVKLMAERKILDLCHEGSKSVESEFGMFAVLASWMDREGPLADMSLCELQTLYGLKDKKKFNRSGVQTERASMHARRQRLERFLKRNGFLGYKAPGSKSASACETYAEAQTGNTCRTGALGEWAEGSEE